MTENGKQEWRSQYMTGTLHRNDDAYAVEWDAPVSLATAMNEAGRGAELSELVRFNGGLYSFDDRTGIMFEILNPEDRCEGHTVERAVGRSRGTVASSVRVKV